MNLNELFAVRESCRNYLDKKVDNETIRSICDLARLAPSAVNAQPWKMLAVTSEDKVAVVADAVMEGNHNLFCAKAPAFIVMLEERAAAEKIPVKPHSQNNTFFDMGGLTSHLCLAASEAGLGTCILGWFNEVTIREGLSVPDEYIISMVVSVGYSADEAPRAKKRKSLEEVFEII